MEVKISNLETLREQLEEDMRGLCMCDYITKQDKINYLNDFDEWSKTAKMEILTLHKNLAIHIMKTTNNNTQ